MELPTSPTIPPKRKPEIVPATTEEMQFDQEAKTLRGQRNVNIVWEVTQALIAVLVTVAVLIVAVHNGISSTDTINNEFPAVLSNAFFLIVGFYFSRTNHQAIGGTGRKANVSQSYMGR